MQEKAGRLVTAPAEGLVTIREGFRWDDCDAYLFDIDGTLLHAHGGVHTGAFSSSVQAVMGHPLPIDSVPVHGSTDTGILRDAFRLAAIPDEVWQPRLEEILDLMRQQVLEQRERMSVTVMPGVLSMLAYLKSRGKRLGVATGNLEQIGWLKIEIAGLRDWFTFGGFSDRHAVRSEMIAQALAAASLPGRRQGVRGRRHALGYRRGQGQFPAHHRRSHRSLFLPGLAAAPAGSLHHDPGSVAANGRHP